MAPLALTPVQRKLLKWLVRRAEEIIPPVALYLWSVLDEDGTVTPDPSWTRWHVRWTKNTPAGVSEDLGEFKMDVLNITSGAVDNSWTSADLLVVHNALYALRTALLPYLHSSQVFQQNVAYKMKFNNAMDPKKPFLPTGPPVYLSSVSAQAGTGTGLQAYQVSGSVTFKTAFPRHWGRSYLPTPPNARLDTYGRFDSTYRSGVANAFRTCFDTLQAADMFPVIPLTQAEKQPLHALLGALEIQVDDIPDVIRRRRVKTTQARTVT